MQYEVVSVGTSRLQRTDLYRCASPHEDCNTLPKCIAERKRAKYTALGQDSTGFQIRRSDRRYARCTCLFAGLTVLPSADCGLETTAAPSAPQPRRASAGNIFSIHTRQMGSLISPVRRFDLRKRRVHQDLLAPKVHKRALT